MTAQLLAGAPVADSVLDEVKIRTRALIEKGIKPGLGTILVGEDSASAGYVRKKHETCEAVGLASQHIEIPSDASPNALLEAVDSFNKDPEVHAYIIQHPVADGFDFNTALSLMNPEKDADGLHPVNLGKLVLQEKGPVPCTPAGIQAILVYYGIETSGKHVVVIGRGPTLGRPMALLMSSKEKGANAAVTVVHSAVPNLSEITSKADIVIAAVGIPSFVTSEMVRPGSVVISGGISWEGKKLLPDVDESVGEVASWITPRLGGVGPVSYTHLTLPTKA